MHEIVRILKKRVLVYPKPAVFISGGIDSTIILHHLLEKTNEDIHTFTFGFSDIDNEFEPAKRVAEHYGTIHHEVMISNVLDTLYELYKKIHFPRPLFHIWMYWPLKIAHEIDIKNVYFGEGLDEHFGGYWYKPKKPYQDYWSDHWFWIRQPYEILAKHFGINIHLPFADIDARITMKWWDSDGDKFNLRLAYDKILPDFVVERKKKSQAPDWKAFYEREMEHLYGIVKRNIPPEYVRECLNDFVTRLWLLMSRRGNR